MLLRGLRSRGSLAVSLQREMSTARTSYRPRGTASAMPMYPLKGLPYSEHTSWYLARNAGHKETRFRVLGVGCRA
jgi:hypothetical protein